MGEEENDTVTIVFTAVEMAEVVLHKVSRETNLVCHVTAKLQF